MGEEHKKLISFIMNLRSYFLLQSGVERCSG